MAEFSEPGNFSQVVKKLIEEGIKANSRSSFKYENNFHVHCSTNDTFSYVVIAETGYSRLLAFELIEVIKDLRYPCNADLAEKTKKFNLNQDEDKITRINNQVNEINGIVIMNIQKVLKNTLKLEAIAKKTDEMQSRALIFKKSGEELFSIARCQNIKWTIICSCCGIGLLIGLGFVFYYAVN